MIDPNEIEISIDHIVGSDRGYHVKVNVPDIEWTVAVCTYPKDAKFLQDALVIVKTMVPLMFVEWAGER